jgi:hypothetical protein
MPNLNQLQRPGANIAANGAGPPGVKRGLSALYMDAFFQYGANALFDGTGANTLTVNIPIQADAHFMCVHTMVNNSAEVGASGGTVILQGGGVVQIQDGASQRFLNNIAVPVQSLFGTAREPYVWPFTHVFRANGFIGITVTGAGATMANATLRFVFSGIKMPIGSLPVAGL